MERINLVFKYYKDGQTLVKQGEAHVLQAHSNVSGVHFLADR